MQTLAEFGQFKQFYDVHLTHLPYYVSAYPI
jgi:hypothetical protein